MSGDYSLPRFFTDDLFKLVGERRRPPYRWFVAGPERSGSYIHIDPLGTSAWNALLRGHKLWALFRPSVQKEVVQPKNCGGREAIAWFANVLPMLQAAEVEEHRPITVIQAPGETTLAARADRTTNACCTPYACRALPDLPCSLRFPDRHL